MTNKPPSSLSSRAKALADLVAQGVDLTECVERTGYPREYVQILMASPFFQALVEHKRGETLTGLREIIKHAMERAVPEAFEAIRYLAQAAKNESVRQRAAEFLIQYGYGAAPSASSAQPATGPAVQIVFEGYENAPQTIAAVLEQGRALKSLQTYATELETPPHDA